MSNNLTTYGANALLNGTAMPATLWVKMHIGNPGPAALNFPSADTRRRSFTRSTSTAGLTIALADLEWLNWAAPETLTHASIWDADHPSGNPWWVGPLASSVSILATERLVIPVADSALQLSVPIWS